MDLFLIDAIGPFFLDYEKDVINWSKIPFENLEKNEQLDVEKFQKIENCFSHFCELIAAMGFNAITLDDVAHLIDSPLYPETLRKKITAYQEQYKKLFQIAKSHGLQIYITSDVMFFHESTRKVLGNNISLIAFFLKEAIDGLFESFYEISGIIFRIGESDNHEVVSDFRSELVLRTPADARELLVTMLPTFEKYERNLIMRTWSVGSHSIGDLIWNRNTFWKVFSGIDSERLIISMKYGESDFFRYLPLNKLFFYSNHKKIIELQARREYEGFGQYPAFVGWEYEAYAAQLSSAENVVGCSIWCQTGGWTKFRQLTFLSNSSIWNELNTFAALRIFKDRYTAEQAIHEFYERHFYDTRWELFCELLLLSDQVLRELLYIEDFSGKKIFFRRVRVPPLIWVFWDQIIINHLMRKIIKIYVENPELVVAEGKKALLKLRRMEDIAQELGIEKSGIHFQQRTFEVLSAAREYYLLPFSEEIVERLRKLKDEYDRDYPDGYDILLDFKNMTVSRRHLQKLLELLLRDKRGYRLFDKLVTIGALRLMYPLAAIWERTLPSFSKDRAMGLRSIFR